MTRDGVLLLLAGLGALLQVPLLGSTLKLRADTRQLVDDPTFDVIDGGDMFGNAPPSPWQRLAQLHRPAMASVVLSGIGIAIGLAATVVGIWPE